MSVISIRGLSYAYPPVQPGGQPVWVLQGIDLDVERGEFLSLMGPTGAGKSTLCLALNGLVPQSTGGVIRGLVTVLGHDTRRTPVASLAEHIGVVYQDHESQLFCASVEDEIAFGPENLAVDPKEIAERVAWALDAVDMAEYRHRAPTQLSGGQKQRVAIAASLAMLPDLLILDEPTASLDPVGQYEVFSVIESLCRERRMTIVMVSQDAEHVASFSDRVALMCAGNIVHHEEPGAFFYATEPLVMAGVAPPQVCELSQRLHAEYGKDDRYTSLPQAHQALLTWLSSARAEGKMPS